MNSMTVQFWFRCGVIVAATAVLALAMVELGVAGEATGICAGIQKQYAQLSILPPASRALALTARICSL